jgi:hypothetical protein
MPPFEINEDERGWASAVDGVTRVVRHQPQQRARGHIGAWARVRGPPPRLDGHRLHLRALARSMLRAAAGEAVILGIRAPARDHGSRTLLPSHPYRPRCQT